MVSASRVIQRLPGALAWLPDNRAAPSLSVALIGPGRVGSRLLERLVDMPTGWTLTAVVNSTAMAAGSALNAASWQTALEQSDTNSDLDELTRVLDRQAGGQKVIVDATASEQVASRHAHWLASGFNVVTANKWALAAPMDEYRQLFKRRNSGKARYECAATVGAGLPVLNAICQLRRAGESIREVAGALSGTMTSLVGAVNAGNRPSQALACAHADGLTEPDPRHDLDGVDVARKLVILAREAGIELELADVHIDSLVPPQLRNSSLEAFMRAGPLLDDYWSRRAAVAPGQGTSLSFTGRIDHQGCARVGLEKVLSNSALARLEGADNRVEIFTDCYRDRPLVIQGPGAGIEVTALALWSGLKRISESAEPGC